MKKILAILFCIIVLAGCTEKKEEEQSVNSIFKDELSKISSIGEAKGKLLAEEITVDNVQAVFDDIFSFAIFENSDVKIGEVSQGTGPDGNGGRIFCCKLPVEVSFTGGDASIKKFAEYISKYKNVISCSDVKIDKLQEDVSTEEMKNQKYKFTSTINFFGKTKEEGLASSKNEYTIKKNEVEVEEEKETSLRDFDVSMIIRPSNSDSSAISLGVTSDKDYRIFDDSNAKKDVVVTFTNDSGKYFAEYSIDGAKTTKVQIKPSGNILFDIVSCSIEEKDDEIATDLHIINNSNKKVSTAIYDDKDGRVNVVEKVGNVEVKK